MTQRNQLARPAGRILTPRRATGNGPARRRSRERRRETLPEPGLAEHELGFRPPPTPAMQKRIRETYDRPASCYADALGLEMPISFKIAVGGRHS